MTHVWVKFRWEIFIVVLLIDSLGFLCETALRWLSLDPTDDKSLVALSHYLSKCWHSSTSMSPYGVTHVYHEFDYDSFLFAENATIPYSSIALHSSSPFYSHFWNHHHNNNGRKPQDKFGVFFYFSLCRRLTGCRQCQFDTYQPGKMKYRQRFT